MKVQMQGQALRIRISEAELARLLDGETVENLTRLPGNMAHHQLRMVEAGEPALFAAPGGWAFSLPRGELEPYVARLPCRDGLVVRLPVEQGGDLEVEFEVDVRDSVRSRGMGKRGAQFPAAPDRNSG
ncbi:hypothetical protein [Aerolutibacter daejeonensis]|uniref:hypothetical protein n=1 Tax=Aerolutibacter daejeonensis TaxID=346181 RepID=UPI00068AD9F6|nr:hypothetical protein [Lysobacter daejeonensis]